MRSRPTLSDFFALVSTLLLSAGHPPFSAAQPPQAQAPAPTGGVLTVDRIYSEPSLSGHLTRGIAWTPDSKQISFFESNATGKAGRTELWTVDVASGQRRVILSAEKLESLLPADAEQSTQATGLGRHPPAEYQWAPGGGALLFQGPTSVAWFYLKTQVSLTPGSGE